MKYIAITLVILTLACTAFGLHIYLNTSLNVVDVSVKSVDARNMTDKFFKDRADIQNGTMPARIFSDTIENGNDYCYLTYTVKLQNNLLVDVESLELQVVPKNGDAYQELPTILNSIKSKEKAELTAQLLSKKSTIGIREFVINYYVWGIPFKLEYTFK